MAIRRHRESLPLTLHLHAHRHQLPVFYSTLHPLDRIVSHSLSIFACKISMHFFRTERYL